MNDGYIGCELMPEEKMQCDATMGAAQYADDCARRLSVRECWLRIKFGTFTQADIEMIDAELRRYS